MMQFSVWKEKWPEDAFQFLIAFDCGVRWYHLFEPNLLVRLDGENQNMLDEGHLLAYSLGMEFREGDIARSSPSGANGKFYYGESGFYGSRELGAHNTEWLFVSSALLRQLERENKRNFKFLRKHIHLFCNQANMNYLAEAWFLLRCALQSFYLFLRCGLQ